MHVELEGTVGVEPLLYYRDERSKMGIVTKPISTIFPQPHRLLRIFHFTPRTLGFLLTITPPPSQCPLTIKPRLDCAKNTKQRKNTDPHVLAESERFQAKSWRFRTFMRLTAIFQLWG